MRRSSRFTLYVLLFILLLATSLRFVRITYQSYWNDEGNSRALAGYAAPDIIRSAAADIHPPGYYLALAGWRALMGESELALRGFSALAGVVLVALLYRLGREYFDQRAALMAALLGAVNPFLVYYSQEARMYELLAMLSAASFLLFSLWLKSSRPHPPTPSPERQERVQERGRGWGNWKLGVGYCLISAAGLYTHYAFPFVIIAQNLAALGGLLFHRRGHGLKRLAVWFGLQFFTLLLFTFWLPIALRQLTTWPATRASPSFFSALADTARYLALGRTIPTEQVWLALIAVGVLLLLGLRRGGQTITPLLWLAVPAGLTLAFGLLTEAFAKFLLVAVPPLCLLLGNGVIQGGRKKECFAGRRTLRATFYILRFALVFIVLYFTTLSLNNLYFDSTYFRDDYRGIARYVESIARTDDAVITISPNQVQAFEYYHRSGAEVFPLPHTRPPDRAETEQALDTIAATHSRIFVLFWGERQADPEGIVENWLNTNAFKAGDQWYGQVRLATYAVSEPATEMAVPSGARFGEDILLNGYTLQSETLTPNEILRITLFWQTDKMLKERYKVFVHLYAALDAPPVAQQDGEPGGGRFITSEWQPGVTIADNHGILLPPDLPPGDYTLVVGLYNLFDGTRLPITINDVAVGDRLELITITVK